MERELRARGIIDKDQVLTEWQLRLKLRLVVGVEEREAARKLADNQEPKQEDSACELLDETDSEEERKYIFVRHNGRLMVF
ncbi:hypothetical protein ACN47E_005675 [Coniothyrium glycines]